MHNTNICDSWYNDYLYGNSRDYASIGIQSACNHGQRNLVEILSKLEVYYTFK